MATTWSLFWQLLELYKAIMMHFRTCEQLNIIHKIIKGREGDSYYDLNIKADIGGLV